MGQTFCILLFCMIRQSYRRENHAKETEVILIFLYDSYRDVIVVSMMTLV